VVSGPRSLFLLSDFPVGLLHNRDVDESLLGLVALPELVSWGPSKLAVTEDVGRRKSID
jgi:hypothetical protein